MIKQLAWLIAKAPEAVLDLAIDLMDKRRRLVVYRALKRWDQRTGRRKVSPIRRLLDDPGEANG